MTYKWNTCVCLAIVVSLLWPGVLLAGQQYLLQCENKGCNYHDHVSFGGSRLTAQITGFCASTGKFVYLSWDREGMRRSPSANEAPRPRPTPISHIWWAETGENVPLYQSKDCPYLFVPVESIESLKFCPKCRQSTLKSTLTKMFD